MTFAGGRESPLADVDAVARARLGRIADALIPEAHGMPAASAAGVSAGQLDVVVRARPDLLAPLRRALDAAAGTEDATERGSDRNAEIEGDIPGHAVAVAWLDELARIDPEAHGALILVVLAGYYGSEQVKEALGYPGQQAKVVSTAFPAYIEEGLLDPVLERGTIYREPPEGSAPEWPAPDG